MAQHPINKARGAKLGNALKGAGFDYPLDPQSAIVDALASLRHLADKHGLCFGDCDRIAYGHYLTEAHRPDDIEWDARRMERSR